MSINILRGNKGKTLLLFLLKKINVLLICLLVWIPSINYTVKYQPKTIAENIPIIYSEKKNSQEIKISYTAKSPVELTPIPTATPTPIITPIPTIKVKTTPIPVKKVSSSNIDAKSFVKSKAINEYGWNNEQWEALDFIVSHESGWNYLAVNKSSSACSLFQALPCSKIPGDWRMLENQVPWGLNYIKNRYGDPVKAKIFWDKHGWY